MRVNLDIIIEYDIIFCVDSVLDILKTRLLAIFNSKIISPPERMYVELFIWLIHNNILIIIITY